MPAKVRCKCGWESVLIDSDEAADRAFEAHVMRVHGRTSPDPDYPIEHIVLSSDVRDFLRRLGGDPPTREVDG